MCVFVYLDQSQCVYQTDSPLSFRSLCTVVCKWTYCPTEKWDTSFWTAIGLEDLLENDHSKIGEQSKPVFNINGVFLDKLQINKKYQTQYRLVLVSQWEYLPVVVVTPATVFLDIHLGSVTCYRGSPVGEGLTHEAATHQCMGRHSFQRSPGFLVYHWCFILPLIYR